jgi:D-alanyl-D-alanine endopeptidase (penicillin-binding protein 7)
MSPGNDQRESGMFKRDGVLGWALVAALTMAAPWSQAFPGAPSVKSASWAALDAQGHLVAGRLPDQPRPIASITKLALAMAYLDANPDLQGFETISQADVDVLKHTSSRLPVGTRLRRSELLRLALASSENRAAAALARGRPGGVAASVAAMNAKAARMGWSSAKFVDATGLSAGNVASARDVASMARAARAYPQIREAALALNYSQLVEAPGAAPKTELYKNTNKPLRGGLVEAEVSKTGYTNEAGKCLAWALPARRGAYALAVLAAPSFPARDADQVALSAWAGRLAGFAPVAPGLALASMKKVASQAGSPKRAKVVKVSKVVRLSKVSKVVKVSTRKRSATLDKKSKQRLQGA